jgi:magnesium-transporting ATPase (P-type)
MNIPVSFALKDFASQKTETVLSALQTGEATGLSSSEAANRLKQYGPNAGI